MMTAFYKASMVTIMTNATKQWQFWVDRGGTFTDIVACDPAGKITTDKLLSDNPSHYQDAAIHGIHRLMSIPSTEPLPTQHIEAVRMGTTVATNALLEHKGEPLLLVTTKGFADALRIGYQQRPDLFALDIELPVMLYRDVIEIDERLQANGNVLSPIDKKAVHKALKSGWQQGLRAVAIVFMHGYRYPQHEKIVAEIAKNIGFSQISTSHQSNPVIRFVSRGDTTVIDAYLSPILRRYTQQIAQQLPNTPLLFMQSNGGLTEASYFQGKDAILSGPAGGIVGMVRTAEAEGFKQIIGFDMGGTSTDVCHYNGEYETTTEVQIAGMRVCAPMLRIHTVAAGGGSLLHFDQERFSVGPDSAGATPGPAAYGAGGELTITDCNILLGKLQPHYFPAIFGEQADAPLNTAIVQHKFAQLAKQLAKQATHTTHSAETIATGFLAIAVENMANSIKEISVQRGYDVTQYTLSCFGGAGGQHACLVADALGVNRIFFHQYSGILSAYGMGLADRKKSHTQSIDLPLATSSLPALAQVQQTLNQHVQEELQQQGLEHIDEQHCTLLCRYQDADSTLKINLNGHSRIETLQNEFTALHQQHYGFHSPEKTIVIASMQVDGVVKNIHSETLQAKQTANGAINAVDNITTITPPTPSSHEAIYSQGQWKTAPFYLRDTLSHHAVIQGPAVIIEATATLVIEVGWQAKVTAQNNIVLTRDQKKTEQAIKVQQHAIDLTAKADPVLLEIFNNVFMSIAEQMGSVLEKTAVSVNIKERMDFSCAVFDQNGQLVANAPHMPVHLGSMSESIQVIIRENSTTMQAGDAFMLNDPYNGGTHLPDITVIKPIFDDKQIIFYLAARGHHADVGGITPGSIPPDSTHINQEGILINNFHLVKHNTFQEHAVRTLFATGNYPARNIDYNIADLKAQLAACEKGSTELQKLITQYGLITIQAYMQHIQHNAEVSVRRLITTLHSGKFSYPMDDGSQICVQITIDTKQQHAHIDFSGTSQQHAGNLNAPTAITRAAVLYVFRCLVDANIPLNEGCLKPLTIFIPEDCMLNPRYPAAVVAGNVETSQYVVDTLFAALGVMAAAQGTMNNVTWGNQHYQYYETLCGGAGATAKTAGADAVHTHMTNSRLTDPEILEQRFPVLLEEFSIRQHSGGKGKHKGGEGVSRKTRFLQPMTANILSGHRHIQPYGLQQGEMGKTGKNSVIRHDGTKETLSWSTTITVDKNDVLHIITPGGGGYGHT
jgi:5-oxoprolinase (ATP-hydrolysing)